MQFNFALPRNYDRLDSETNLESFGLDSKNLNLESKNIVTNL